MRNLCSARQYYGACAETRPNRTVKMESNNDGPGAKSKHHVNRQGDGPGAQRTRGRGSCTFPKPLGHIDLLLIN